MDLSRYIIDGFNVRVKKHYKSDLSYVSQKTSGLFSQVMGIWGDGTYLYIADYSSRLHKLLASDMSEVDFYYAPLMGWSEFPWSKTSFNILEHIIP